MSERVPGEALSQSEQAPATSEPASPARVRFAPSPTGPLHVGSARTALLNWLFARSPAGGRGAKVLLRIDDTDRERSHADFEQAIVSDLKWLGLDWDEGPVRQSERAARYAEALAALPTVERDGAQAFAAEGEEPRVIARADGSALYHLASAVDDLDFGVTHVLRGRDHVSNTPIQEAIIRALGGEPPEYVHAPLLTLPDGAKISKREGHEVGGGGLTIAGMREAGFPASAVLNHLALSLADFGTAEVMTDAATIAARFELRRLHSADSHFDVEKLRWLSGQHIRSLPIDVLASELGARMGSSFGSREGADSDSALPAVAVAAAQTAGETFAECAEVARDLLDPPAPDAEAAALATSGEADAATAVLLELLTEALNGGSLVQPRPPVDLDAAELVFDELKSRLRERDVKLGPALRGLRARLSGRAHGPEFPYVLATLSSERLAQLRDRA